MRSIFPKRCGAIVPIIGLLCLAAFGSEKAAAQNPLWTASIIVKDANGTPVEGAIACLGIVIDVRAYGQAVTNASGVAYFDAQLPEGPTTIYFTAGKDGHGAQAAQSWVSPTAPFGLTAHIQLPPSPGGTVCPGGGSGSSSSWIDIIQGILQGMEAPSELESRELFEIKLILKRPPPISIVVGLESSHPGLVRMPRRITIRPGERTVSVRAEITAEVHRRETVTLTGRLADDPRQIVRSQIVVNPAGGRTDGGDRK